MPRAVTVAVLVLVAGACASTLERWQKIQTDHAANLRETYPAGMERTDLRARFPELKDTPIRKDHSFIRFCLDGVQDPGFLDTQLVSRGFLGFGLYCDYVFYDRSQRVLASFRQHVD